MRRVALMNGPGHRDHHGDDAVVVRPTARPPLAAQLQYRHALDLKREANHSSVVRVSTLFQQLVFYFDGFVGEHESIMRLQALVRAHSGRVVSFLSAQVTHIVAVALAATKDQRRLTLRRSTAAALVSPDFIAAAVAARKLPNTADFRPPRTVPANVVVDNAPLTRWFSKDAAVDGAPELAVNDAREEDGDEKGNDDDEEERVEHDDVDDAEKRKRKRRRLDRQLQRLANNGVVSLARRKAQS